MYNGRRIPRISILKKIESIYFRRSSEWILHEKACYIIWKINLVIRRIHFEKINRNISGMANDKQHREYSICNLSNATSGNIVTHRNSFQVKNMLNWYLKKDLFTAYLWKVTPVYCSEINCKYSFTKLY